MARDNQPNVEASGRPTEIPELSHRKVLDSNGDRPPFRRGEGPISPVGARSECSEVGAAIMMAGWPRRRTDIRLSWPTIRMAAAYRQSPLAPNGFESHHRVVYVHGPLHPALIPRPRSPGRGGEGGAGACPDRNRG